MFKEIALPITFFVSSLGLVSCRDESIEVIQDLGRGLRYEQWNFIKAEGEESAPRLITVRDPETDESEKILIPGNIVKCDIGKNHLWGYKKSYPDHLRGSKLEDSRWRISGYFMITTEGVSRLLDLKINGESKVPRVQWFQTEGQLVDRLRQVGENP